MATIVNIFESKLKSGQINEVSTEFGGGDEFAEVTNDVALEPELVDFSFLARITQKVLAGNKALFGFSNSAGTKFLVIGWDNGRPYFQWEDTVAGDSFQTSAGSQFTTLDQFFTLGLTADRNGNIKLFIDGILDVTDDFNPASSFDMKAGEVINIGGVDNLSLYHEGLIDEIVYWKGVAMTDTEMQTLLYNNGHTINPRSKAFYMNPNQIKKTVEVSRGGFLVAHYKMGDGDTFPFIRDHSEDDHHAKMINMEAADFKTITAP